MSRSRVWTSQSSQAIRAPSSSLDRNLYSSYNSQTNSRSQSPSMPDYDSINFTRTSSSRFSSRANTPDRPPQHSMYRGIAGSGTISPAAIAAPPRSLSSPGQLKSTLLTTPYDVLPTQGGQSVSVVQSASTPPPRSRSPSPFNSSSEMLLKKSRKQRMSSIPPPAPSPTNMSAKPPIAGSARVVASDFYRGKVKSIYEREPLWQEFSSSVSGKGYNMYNSEHLSNIKNDFKGLVEDKYRRVRSGDPSVGRDAGSKLWAWNDVLHKPPVPASQFLGEKHSARKREPSPAKPMPKIRLYHKSTF